MAFRGPHLKWGAVLLLAGLSFGQMGQSPKAPDSAATAPQVLPTDSASAAKSLSSPDSSKSPRNRADTVSVIKYHFNHREQIITGSVVMVCLALILAVMNNYNPR